MAEKYTSLYKKDPIAAELEAGIQGTDVYQGSPYALSSVPEFEGIKSATTDYNRYQDLYNLYLGGGFDAAQDAFVTPPATTPGGSGGGGGEATLPGFDVDSPKNTPFEQNLLDQGIGVQGAPGDPVVAPGEMPVTQEEMDAFNQIPVSSDPFLVSGAAGATGAQGIQGPAGDSGTNNSLSGVQNYNGDLVSNNFLTYDGQVSGTLNPTTVTSGTPLSAIIVPSGKIYNIKNLFINKTGSSHKAAYKVDNVPLWGNTEAPNEVNFWLHEGQQLTMTYGGWWGQNGSFGDQWYILIHVFEP